MSQKLSHLPGNIIPVQCTRVDKAIKLSIKNMGRVRYRNTTG
jgi:hypothetical protein